MPAIRVAIVTASDTREQDNDSSGTLLFNGLRDAGHDVVERRIVRDDEAVILEALGDLVAVGVDVIVITGGTGVSPRDQAPEAVARFCPRSLPGFGELFRQLSFAEIGSRAMTSRACAGVHEGTVVFALPGSPAACRLGLERILLPELSHVVSMIHGGGHTAAD